MHVPRRVVAYASNLRILPLLKSWYVVSKRISRCVNRQWTIQLN